MGSTVGREVVTLDHAGEALTFGGAGYINQLTNGEDLNSDSIARLEVGQIGGGQRKLDQTQTCFNASLGEVARGSLNNTAGLLEPKVT